METRPLSILLLLLLTMLPIGCNAEVIDPLPPDEYLESALSWLEAHAVTGQDVDWQAVRQEAAAIVPDPQTTADTYPAIKYALAQLDDGIGYLSEPPGSADTTGFGIMATFPEGIVVGIYPDSPAEKAGIQMGDLIESADGKPPQPETYHPWITTLSSSGNNADLLIRREGSDASLSVQLDTAEYNTSEGHPTGRKLPLSSGSVVYVDLVADWGSRDYPTRVQKILRDEDDGTTCGWIIDLRRNVSGDIWSYLAAIGPILGEGEVGGFVYPDGAIEDWSYRDGKVFWAGDERGESYIRGSIFVPNHPDLPVALLFGKLTHDAGELVAVAFQGRANVRTFGEPTAGVPHLNLHTPLSDGASLGVSGAVARDRAGKLYDEPISPDEKVIIDWRRLGRPDDPVIMAAQEWLAAQLVCAQ